MTENGLYIYNHKNPTIHISSKSYAQIMSNIIGYET